MSGAIVSVVGRHTEKSSIRPLGLGVELVPLKMKKKKTKKKEKWCLGARPLEECGWRLYIEGALSSFASFEREGM